MTDSTLPDADIPASVSERLAKRMARAGLCSRRDAERWIAEGRVRVNGTVVRRPAFNVTENDSVIVDGKALPDKDATRLWRYHKPSGLVVTARDEKGRPTIFERLPRELPRVLSVGRLDLNSEGLLLLTNDGDLARKLELPATGWIRRYRVRVRGLVQEDRLAALINGITIDGVRYGEIRASLERQQGQNAWLSVALTEGKNREVRRVMEYLGYSVNRLIRIAYGPFNLGTLARGGVEEVSAKVMRDLIGGESRKGQAKWAKAKPKPKTPRSRKPRPKTPDTTASQQTPHQNKTHSDRTQGAKSQGAKIQGAKIQGAKTQEAKTQGAKQNSRKPAGGQKSASHAGNKNTRAGQKPSERHANHRR